MRWMLKDISIKAKLKIERKLKWSLLVAKETVV